MTSPESPPRTELPQGRSAAHVFTLVAGWASIVLGCYLPLATALNADADNLHLARWALGLLPVGLFLVTRPRPKRPASAIWASLLMPVGAAVLATGLLSPESLQLLRVDTTSPLAGAALLAAGIIHAWITWARSNQRPVQVATRAFAVVVWIVFGVVSLQSVAFEALPDYIEPLSMRLDGAQLTVEMPYQGGCAQSQVVIDTKMKEGVLEVLVYDEDGFRCLAGCLSSWRAICTDSVTRTLTQIPPPGTPIIAADRPPTGLQRIPLAFLIAGLALGGGLWVLGGRMSAKEHGASTPG